MKIVYLTFSLIPSALADSVQSMRMCNGLARAGHEVILLAPDRPLWDPVDEDVFAYYGLEPRFEVRKLPWIHVLNREYVYGALVARHARRLAPDLVYSRVVWQAMWAAAAGLPVIFESHSPVGGRITRPLFKRFLRSPYLLRLVVISDALARYYVEVECLDPGRIVVARDGADLPPAELPKPKDWPGREGHVQVGYFGSLVAGRGLDLVGELARRFPEMDFHVVGGRPGQVAFWRERLSLPNVHFHGWVAPRDMARWQMACDILLAPYERKVSIGLEGSDTSAWMSPMKLFEYMAAGRAVMASDLPALREFLDHGRTAWLCPPNDASAWSDALAKLAAEPELRARLGAAARAEVAEKYTWEKRAQLVLAGLQ